MTTFDSSSGMKRFSSDSLEGGDAVELELHATVSGSFRKHLAEIKKAVRALQDAGVQVLSPDVFRTVRDNGDFVYLEGDSGSPSDVEMEHLKAICASDFLYVVNPKGYVGTSSAFEMGFARASRIPIYCQEKPADSVLVGLVEFGVAAVEIAQAVATKKRRSSMRLPSSDLRLREIQSYVAEMVRQKGFARESLRDVLLLLLEETGELARTVRERSGLKSRTRTKGTEGQLGAELADCFIYIVDLANLADVDFEATVRRKLASDARRRWRSSPDLSG